MGIEISASAEWELPMRTCGQSMNHLCLIKCSSLSANQI